MSSKEPEIQDKWKRFAIYENLKDMRQGCPQKVLHSGPPYANGHLHMGHALNGLLKDIMVRFERLKGHHVSFIPGWDCHGLPIEWKIEERYRKEKKNKDDIPPHEFRKRCREFAQHWVKIQSEEFQRLGISADWEHPYKTDTPHVHHSIVQSIYELLDKGLLYRGVKPVLWSVVEKTALAEAEVEYKDRAALAIDVAFEVVQSPLPEVQGAYGVIWTTTPWSLPSNRAIAYAPQETYVVLEEAHTKKRYIVAQNLWESCAKRWNRELRVLRVLPSEMLAGCVSAHPWKGRGYDFSVPWLPGEHVSVTSGQGTGLVHTAPEHGMEDFLLCKEHKIPPSNHVDAQGLYMSCVPLWAGKSIFKVNEEIVDSLEEALVNVETITHSYPHSWRSGAPLIYRTTPQWFLSLDQLRSQALRELEDVAFYPQESRQRLQSMLRHRPDWCLSRQRVWGVPLAFFVHRETGEPLMDRAVRDQVLAAIQDKGADVWFDCDPRQFLPDHLKEIYEPVMDIVDVWMDSGLSHRYVLNDQEQVSVADWVLEGSDQHRGWFQSSLLSAKALGRSTPYKAIITHGFLLDETGHKLSKSKSNGLTLEDLLKTYGADILRLWVASQDATSDVTLSQTVLQGAVDRYRRLRNTLRYLLGVLQAKGPIDDTRPSISFQDLPWLERAVYEQMRCCQQQWREALESKTSFGYHDCLERVTHFCSEVLSSLYFDIRKDALYCGDPESLEVRAIHQTFHQIFHFLVRWLAPFISFTVEEAWQTLDPESSVHTQTFLELEEPIDSASLQKQWEEFVSFRKLVMFNLEQHRKDKIIGSSLEAHVDVQSGAWSQDLLDLDGLADMCLVSSLSVDEISPHGTEVRVTRATGQKCERCWKWHEAVQDPLNLCPRCQDVVEKVSKPS